MFYYRQHRLLGLIYYRAPFVGFGSSGEGYFRLSAFGVRENVVEAVSRIKALKL